MMNNTEKLEVIERWDYELTLQQFMTSDKDLLEKLSKRKDILLELALDITNKEICGETQ